MERNKDNNHIVDTNKKISSVEWLIQQITANSISDITDEQWFGIMGQAKAMHKEEIEDAWDRGEYIGISFAHRNIDEIYEQNAEQYYKQTYEE